MNNKVLSRLIADLVIFFENADEDYIDVDASVAGTEIILNYVKSMNEDEIFELCKEFRRVSSDYKGEDAKFVKALPELLGLLDEPDDPENGGS